MTENLADFYYNQLSDSTAPGRLLANFYSSLFDVKLEKRHYMMFNKLVKAFGRYNVFFSILSIAEVSNVDHTTNLYPLFSHIIKKRYEDRTSIANVESMESAEKQIKALEKKIKKLEGVDLKIPEEENE